MQVSIHIPTHIRTDTPAPTHPHTCINYIWFIEVSNFEVKFERLDYLVHNFNVQKFSLI